MTKKIWLYFQTEQQVFITAVSSLSNIHLQQNTSVKAFHI